MKPAAIVTMVLASILMLMIMGGALLFLYGCSIGFSQPA